MTYADCNTLLTLGLVKTFIRAVLFFSFCRSASTSLSPSKPRDGPLQSGRAAGTRVRIMSRERCRQRRRRWSVLLPSVVSPPLEKAAVL